MRDVADVGEVEDVEVVADLDLVLLVVVDVDEAGEGLAVAFAEDARGPDGAGEELGVFLTVCGDNGFFGLGLWLSGSAYLEGVEGGACTLVSE